MLIALHLKTPQFLLYDQDKNRLLSFIKQAAKLCVIQDNPTKTKTLLRAWEQANLMH